MKKKRTSAPAFEAAIRMMQHPVCPQCNGRGWYLGRVGPAGCRPCLGTGRIGMIG